jgi:hypothetical protein
MTLEQRVEAYFNSAHDEPAGRLISDLIGALRATNRDLEIWRRNGGDVLLRAEIDQLRTILKAVVKEADRSTRAFNEAHAILGEDDSK